MTTNSRIPADESAAQGPGSSIAQIIAPVARDIGGFEVRRVLPSPGRRSVGPFVFFDQMGPAAFAPAQGINVRPHPHIGLATITYLFEGEVMHRDSLGSAQLIRPGAVNLMTAGRGIVHSERPGPDIDAASRLHGIQSWIALPSDEEETAPAFDHYPAQSIPHRVLEGGAEVRVVMGSAFQAQSPVRTRSPILYLDVQVPAGGTFVLPRGDVEELAVFVAQGVVSLDAGHLPLSPGSMAVISAGADIAVVAGEASRLIVVGGTPLGERVLWWNFVARDPARIEQARADWREGRFPTVPGDEAEFIPLPED